MSLALRQAGIKDTDRLKVARFCEVDFSETISMTSQAFADEVNLNKIMARMQKGQVIMGTDRTPFYGDVSDLGGLQDAYMKTQEAEDLFMQYPAELREKFDNDPVNMVTFLEDPQNYAEALKLGLVQARPAPVPDPVPEPVPGAVKPPTQ